MKNKVIKSLLVICLLFVGLIYFTNDKDIVRKVEGATTGIGTLDNPYIIDEESDFKLMNGSSSYLRR